MSGASPTIRGWPRVRYYVGAPCPPWLTGQDVPAADLAAGLAFFVSYPRLAGRKSLPVAGLPWACDSGAFAELSTHGQWRVSPARYVRDVARFDAEIGRLRWAAGMDWLCGPQVRARTGLSTRDHQWRTIENYLLLRQLWPQESDRDCPFRPTLQGWHIDDFLDAIELYGQSGVRLAGARSVGPGRDWVVGLGSVVGRRPGEVLAIAAAVAAQGIPLHGFGVGPAVLRQCGDSLRSADSMSWSMQARVGWGQRLPGCPHRKCTTCLRYALHWWRTTIQPALSHTATTPPPSAVA